MRSQISSRVLYENLSAPALMFDLIFMISPPYFSGSVGVGFAQCNLLSKGLDVLLDLHGLDFFAFQED